MMANKLKKTIGAISLFAIIVATLALAWWAVQESVFPTSVSKQEAKLTEERKEEFLKSLEKGDLELHPAEYWQPLKESDGE